MHEKQGGRCVLTYTLASMRGVFHRRRSRQSTMTNAAPPAIATTRLQKLHIEEFAAVWLEQILALPAVDRYARRRAGAGHTVTSTAFKSIRRG